MEMSTGWFYLTYRRMDLGGGDQLDEIDVVLSLHYAQHFRGGFQIISFTR